MADPERVVDSDGKTIGWRARWRDPAGAQRKKKFERLADARRHLAAMQADKARGTYVDGADRTTVAEECRAWLERRSGSIKKNTRNRLNRAISNHIEGTPFGARRLVQVRPSEVQAWVNDRAKVMARSSLEKLVWIVRSACADALVDRRLAFSPAVRLTLPKYVAERIVPLSVAQVLALVDAAAAVASRYRAMVIVQAGLGLRVGELLGLRVCDVDFLRRVVRIEHQSDDGTRDLVDPKTASSRRTIPLPQWVADALAVHLAEHPASADIECACPPDVKCSRSTSGLIFHTADALPIHHDYYGSRVFGKVVERANLAIRKANAELPKGATQAAELPADTSSHDLRHHFASVLLAAGESVVAVAEWLGHGSAALVLSTYGHLMPNSEDRMRRAIDGAYADVAASSCAPGVPSRSQATL